MFLLKFLKLRELRCRRSGTQPLDSYTKAYFLVKERSNTFHPFPEGRKPATLLFGLDNHLAHLLLTGFKLFSLLGKGDHGSSVLLVRRSQ